MFVCSLFIIYCLLFVDCCLFVCVSQMITTRRSGSSGPKALSVSRDVKVWRFFVAVLSLSLPEPLLRWDIDPSLDLGSHQTMIAAITATVTRTRTTTTIVTTTTTRTTAMTITIIIPGPRQRWEASRSLNHDSSNNNDNDNDNNDNNNSK